MCQRGINKMTNTTYFNVPFSDLKEEAQEVIINCLLITLKEAAEVDGKKFLSTEWNDPKPTTWQEAYIRYFAIESIMWEDYERHYGDPILGDEVEKPSDEEWAEWLEEHLREIAENNAHQGFKHSEIEVDIC